MAGWESPVCKITRTFSLTGHLMHPLFTLKLFLKRKKKKFAHNVIQSSIRVVRESGGLLSSYRRAKETSSTLTAKDFLSEFTMVYLETSLDVCIHMQACGNRPGYFRCIFLPWSGDDRGFTGHFHLDTDIQITALTWQPCPK